MFYRQTVCDIYCVSQQMSHEHLKSLEMEISFEDIKMFCNMLVDRPSYDHIIFDHQMFVTRPDCLKTLKGTKTSLTFWPNPRHFLQRGCAMLVLPQGSRNEGIVWRCTLVCLLQFAVASTTTQTRTVSWSCCRVSWRRRSLTGQRVNHTETWFRSHREFFRKTRLLT